MKILVIHNRYQIRSGEDTIFEREVTLLKNHGEEVTTLTVDNRDLVNINLLGKIALALNTIWSGSSYRLIQQKIREVQPDIVHVHNILPLLSPSIFYACQANRVPIVQSIHNYRLACPVATFFRNGQICELCLQHSLIKSVQYGCYGSRLQTAVTAAMLQFHRAIKTWKNQVDGYIAVSPFLKQKLIELGISDQKIFVKSNFIETTNLRHANSQFGKHYLFVGRLIEAKGIRLLIQAYEATESRFPLVIAGAGELEEYVQEVSRQNPMIQFVGERSQLEILNLMQQAIALIFPSLWYEGCPNSILEAYSCSLPVIATNLGAMSTMVLPHKTGYLFPAEEPGQLTQRLLQIEAEPESWVALKRGLKAYVLDEYSADMNYQSLIGIYETVIQRKQLAVNQ